jgi:hypothetical protein
MTPFEIRLATALANCSFLPGSSQKRFCRNMGDIARLSPDKELSLRQRHYMELMAWRYRRQLPDECVPHAKPLDLPAVVKPPKAAKPDRLGKPVPTLGPDLFDNNP